MTNKRWGKKYKDKRDWPTYNQELINRGEFYINPKFLSTWRQEIKYMNEGKEGASFLYPDSMIEFLGILHAKAFDYRALQGIMLALSPKYNNFPVISYTQICRRTNELDLEFNSDSNNLIVGVDGSGMKVSNRGEWMREKWKVKRGWVKMVILGDKKGNIVDVRIGNEKLDERKSARGMIRKNKKIKKLLADGLHDDKKTFNLLERLGIEPVIKIRENASTKARGSSARKKEVINYKKQGYKKWAKEKCYGERWLCTEGIFSAVKRIFGETLHASKTMNIYHEARLKLWSYNQLKNLA